MDFIKVSYIKYEMLITYKKKVAYPNNTSLYRMSTLWNKFHISTYTYFVLEDISADSS